MTSNQSAGYSTIAQLIKARQNELGKTDTEIAVALGYTYEKVIVMIKQGTMRLPVNKVVELADVLELEPGEVMRLTLQETDPVLLGVIERCLGPLQLTPAEVRIIEAIRKTGKGRDVVPITFDPDAIVTLIVA